MYQLVLKSSYIRIQVCDFLNHFQKVINAFPQTSKHFPKLPNTFPKLPNTFPNFQTLSPNFQTFSQTSQHFPLISPNFPRSSQHIPWNVNKAETRTVTHGTGLTVFLQHWWQCVLWYSGNNNTAYGTSLISSSPALTGTSACKISFIKFLSNLIKFVSFFVHSCLELFFSFFKSEFVVFCNF